MTGTIMKEHFVKMMLHALDETFESAHGLYIDGGTTFFETLATISAEEASRPVSATCASIAAQVEHVRFSMELTMKNARGEFPEVDWQEIWRTVREVTPEEWTASQQRLRETVDRLRELVTSTPWDDANQIGGALGILMHNAYHLGEIRQALCTIKGGG